MRLTTTDVRGAARVDGRDPARRPGTRRIPRPRGQYQAARPYPGRRQRPRRATTEPGSGRFRAGDALRDLLLKANVTRGRRLVCYDGSGIAAAKLAFVLSLLGHDDVAVYDGGWSEWGDRLDLPVDR